jgi:hypothetical protein
MMILLGDMIEPYYFSTHGWSLFDSFTGAALELEPFVAAASLRAFRSKNPTILRVYGSIN